jgi:hypothetical protein
MKINEQWAKLIEQTGNPTAPLIVQEASSAVDRLGRLMAGMSSPEVVNRYCDQLCTAWDDLDDIEQVCYKPDFVMALAAMLIESLKGWKDNTVRR